MNCAIYRLINPEDNSTIYVGQTKLKIQKRFEYHKAEAFNKNSTQPIHAFMRELKERNIVPVVKLIENCNEKEMDLLEKKWIYYFRDQSTLLNVKHGRPDVINKHKLDTKDQLKPSEIVVFDKNGNKKYYTSFREFLDELNLDYTKNVSTVSKCCRKKIKSFKGFRICYKNEEMLMDINSESLKDKREKTIYLIDLKGIVQGYTIMKALEIVGITVNYYKKYVDKPFAINGFLLSTKTKTNFSKEEIKEIKLSENKSTTEITCFLKNSDGELIDAIVGIRTAASKHGIKRDEIKRRLEDGKPDKNGNYWSCTKRKLKERIGAVNIVSNFH